LSLAASFLGQRDVETHVSALDRNVLLEESDDSECLLLGGTCRMEIVVKVVAHRRFDDGDSEWTIGVGVDALVGNNGGNVAESGFALLGTLGLCGLQLALLEDFQQNVVDRHAFAKCLVELAAIRNFATRDVDKNRLDLQHLREVFLDALAPRHHFVRIARDLKLHPALFQPHHGDVRQQLLTNWLIQFCTHLCCCRCKKCLLLLLLRLLLRRLPWN
jgi:hypothetical protein